MSEIHSARHRPRRLRRTGRDRPRRQPLVLGRHAGLRRLRRTGRRPLPAGARRADAPQPGAARRRAPGARPRSRTGSAPKRTSTAAERFFGERGCAVRRRPAGATTGVGTAVRVADPLGFTVEFFYTIDRAERLIQRYDLHRGAHIARLDHFNIVVPDIPAAYSHYESLGFGCSETIEDEHQMYAAWMFRKQTVHDVAFTSGAGPRLHHLGFATHESHHVLTTCDLFGATEQAAPHRARSRPARRLQRLLRLPPRPRRAPDRGLHQRLLHRRPGPRDLPMERARRTPPGLLGQRGDPLLVRRGDRGPGPRRAPATVDRHGGGRTEVQVGADGLGSIKAADRSAHLVSTIRALRGSRTAEAATQ